MTKKELHIISTGDQPVDTFANIAGEINEYVDYFHIREKQMTAQQVYHMVDVVHKRGIPLSKIVINDRVDVAWSMKVSGVQLAYHSLEVDVVKRHFPQLRVGRSIHSLQEAREAFEHGADFGLYGHIYQTDSKPGLTPRGLEGLKQLTQSTELPIIAIGGIKPQHVKAIIEAGAAGIAVMSGVLKAKLPLKTVKEYVQVLKGE